MEAQKTAAIILAAGHGTRMKSALPKVMHAIGGQAMIAHVMDAASALAPDRISVVIGDHAPEVGEFARSIDKKAAIAVQSPPQGTGHAVMQALPSLEGFSGAAIILYADTPLVTPATLGALAGEIDKGAAVAVLGFTPPEPGAYGRLKRDETGALAAIVEAKDASADELNITLCNSGVMAIDADFLRARLKDIDNKNAKKEYYLTDIVALARKDGKTCAVIEASTEEVLGVNSRVELAEAEAIFQNRMRKAAMENGATLADPSTVYFSWDTKIGKDVVIGQNVVFGPGVTINDNAEIKPFSHLEGANVAAKASAGPFARLRPGANLKTGAKVGNFVEIKKAMIGEGAKVSHLTYIGDAEIGADANIGAGTITCNYDGYNKYKTVIGKGAFIGSNSSLVAPVTIGDGAYVGSGSVVTKDVAPGDLAVARGRQTAIKGWAARFHKDQKSSKKQDWMMDKDAGKKRAAEEAAKYIERGMTLGLGTGSTAAHFVDIVGGLVAQGWDLRGVPTSEATRAHAERLGVEIIEPDETTIIDLAVDGADEADPSLNLIKGGGAALLREKIIAHAARKFIVIADKSKRVAALGAFPLPIEISPYSWALTVAALRRALTASGFDEAPLELRAHDGAAVKTDGGNLIIDARLGRIDDPAALEKSLAAIPGVLECGLFCGMTDMVIYGDEDGISVANA